MNHGGFSQIECTLNLLKTVKKYDIKFEYVHSISGQDFPLCNAQQFDRYFEEHKHGGWMHYDTSREHEEWSKPHGKYEERYMRHWFIDEYHNKKFWIIPVYAACKIVERFVYFRKPLPMRVFAGWSWFSWSKEVTDFVLEYLADHPEYLKRFRHTSCCDELIFHTLLHPYLEKLDIVSDNSLRFIEWHPKRPYSSLPLILGYSEFEQMARSGALFCRKVHPTSSAKLLNHIESSLL